MPYPTGADIIHTLFRRIEETKNFSRNYLTFSTYSFSCRLHFLTHAASQKVRKNWWRNLWMSPGKAHSSRVHTTDVLVPFDAAGLKGEASVLCLCSSKVILVKSWSGFFYEINMIWYFWLVDHEQFIVHEFLVLFITILSCI